MKKFLSILLALVLCLSLGVTAFADNTESVKVSFTVTGGDVYTGETLTYTSTPDSGNPDTSNITVASVTVNGASATAAITLPDYTKAGVYKYTIKQDAQTTLAQGVTYSTDEVGITVLVAYEDGELKSTVGVTKVGNDKPDEFKNTYDLGTLEVKKTVAGNLGDKNKEFDVKVTFTAENTVKSAISYTDDGTDKTIDSGWTGSKEATITLKDSETVTFTNIPAGVTYKVEEDAKYAQGDLNSENGYTVTYSNDTGTIAKDTTATATITNTKETTVDTGISLDSLPYVLILVGVAAVAVVLVARKRRVTD